MLKIIIKQMTSVFVDNSGSPIIDSRCNILLVDGKPEYVQSIINAFRTLKYSETLMPPYGFDLNSVIHMPQFIDPAVVVRSAAVDCLNPSYIKGLLEISSLNARVDTEKKTATIDLSFLGEDGNTYTHVYTFNTGED